jgi:hypothetical protein
MQKLGDVIDELVPESPEGPVRIRTERVEVDLPLEVRVERDAEGALTISATAPTQTFRTSVLPVFHRVRVSIEPEDAE